MIGAGWSVAYTKISTKAYSKKNSESSEKNYIELYRGGLFYICKISTRTCLIQEVRVRLKGMHTNVMHQKGAYLKRQTPSPLPIQITEVSCSLKPVALPTLLLILTVVSLKSIR